MLRQLKNRKEKTTGGDCYVSNGRFIIDKLLQGDADIHLWKLCHGTAVGRDEIAGIKHGHCWIEFNDSVAFDHSNGGKIVMRKEQYYALGKITNVKKYSAEEARKMMLMHKHWGSWEE